MKKTLIQLMQDIASAVDEEPIESISDTLAAEQISAIVEEVFYDTVALELPEHKEFLKLTPASDSSYPTHFQYPTNVADLELVWYDRTEALAGTGQYQEVKWCEPLDFIELLDMRDPSESNIQTVLDKNGGTKLLIQNDKWPQWYTSFDDYWIVMDSWNNTYDDTLQAHKVRAYGRTYPEFDRFDEGYIPDIDDEYHQLLFHESVARFMDRYKGGTTQKQEQASRRARVHLQNDKFRTLRATRRHWNSYGRT